MSHRPAVLRRSQTSPIRRIDLPHFERMLRARWVESHAQIRNSLLRADVERYAQVVREAHDDADESLANSLVDVSLAKVARDARGDHEIEAALRRIALGTYGTCVTCDAPIARARLEVCPTANRCASCQEIHERGRRS
jgi:DnaK suppressor protein